MKKIITISFFIVLYQISFAQSWIKKNDLTDSVIAYNGSAYGDDAAATFTIGSKGYIVAGGNCFDLFVYTWVYDTLADSWDTVQNYPGGNGGVKAGFSINGKGYVGTGDQLGNQWDNVFYEYDPSTDKWISKATFPGTRRGYDVGFALDGMGFIGLGIGNVNPGSTGIGFNDFYEYNPTTDSWKQIANYPGAGNQLCFAFVIGDKAYVGGGITVNSNGQQTAVNDDFWEYDTTSKVWTQVANFGGGLRSQGVAFATCDKGFVGLGADAGGNAKNDVWEFNPNKGTNGTWTQIANYPGQGRTTPNSFVIGKSCFAGMGSSGGCDAVDDWWEYIPSVTPAFSADTSICQGGLITFTDSSNYSPTNWYWQFPGGIPDTSTLQNPTIVYNTAGTYDVVLSAWNGCDSATKTFANYVTVGAGGILTIQPLSPKVCSGQPVILSVSDTGNFTWSPSLGLNSTTGDSVVADPSDTTVYSVTGSSVGGCLATGMDSVIVIPARALIIKPQNTTICNGSSVTLFAPSSGSGYSWSPPATLSSAAADSVIATPTVQTTYTVNGTDSVGCAASGTDIIYVNVGFNKPIIADTDNLLISTATQGNQWYKDGHAISGATGESYTATDTGCYYDIATNIANGCSSISNTLCIDKLAGINLLKINPNLLSIYPNPTGGELFININSSEADVKDWNLQVTDVLGRTVYTKLSLNYTNDIDLSDLPTGVYFIIVTDKFERAVFPIVRQNY